MIKRKIELVRDGQRQALLTWHKTDENGEMIPIAMEFSDGLDSETRERIEGVCARPLNVMENGEAKKYFPGSSKHFGELPRVLARLGFRTRLF
jgi:hypothetical protein